MNVIPRTLGILQLFASVGAIAVLGASSTPLPDAPLANKIALAALLTSAIYSGWKASREPA